MSNALDSGSSFPGSSPGQDHCGVLLDKAPYTQEMYLLYTQVYNQVACDRLLCSPEGVVSLFVALHWNQNKFFSVLIH